MPNPLHNPVSNGNDAVDPENFVFDEDVRGYCEQEKILGFQTITGDGNCFFRAFLAAKGENQEEHDHARSNAINYLREHADEFNFLPHEIGPKRTQVSFGQYLDYMKKTGVYAEGAIIPATAKYYNCSIYVIKLAKKDGKLESTFEAAADFEGAEKHVKLIYINNNHYLAVECPALMQRTDIDVNSLLGDVDKSLPDNSYSASSDDEYSASSNNEYREFSGNDCRAPSYDEYRASSDNKEESKDENNSSLSIVIPPQHEPSLPSYEIHNYVSKYDGKSEYRLVDKNAGDFEQLHKYSFSTIKIELETTCPLEQYEYGLFRDCSKLANPDGKISRIPEEAQFWYAKALAQLDAIKQKANANDSRAQFILGCIFYRGHPEIERNINAAFELNYISAEQGYKEAIQRCYDQFKNEYVEYVKDVHAIDRLRFKAARAGLKSAKLKISDDYLAAVTNMKFIPCYDYDRNESLLARSVFWYRESRSEYPPTYSVYEDHENLRYISVDITAEIEGIVEKIKKEKQHFETVFANAEQGSINAYFELGEMFENGNLYLKADIAEANKWYNKGKNWYLNAARQGNQKAQISLAWMYLQGKYGEKNEARAVFWFCKANVSFHSSFKVTIGLEKEIALIAQQEAALQLGNANITSQKESLPQESSKKVASLESLDALSAQQKEITQPEENVKNMQSIVELESEGHMTDIDVKQRLNESQEKIKAILLPENSSAQSEIVAQAELSRDEDVANVSLAHASDIVINTPPLSVTSAEKKEDVTLEIAATTLAQGTSQYSSARFFPVQRSNMQTATRLGMIALGVYLLTPNADFTTILKIMLGAVLIYIGTMQGQGEENMNQLVNQENAVKLFR